jgi:hypothetical protein
MNTRKEQVAPGRKRKGTQEASAGRERPAVLSRAALDILLSETIEFLLAAGLSKKTLASELRKEASRIGAGLRLRRIKAAKAVREGHENLVEIGGVVHDWHRLRTYTDRRTGEPRALHASELRRLIARRFPRERAVSALRWMQLNGIVRQRRRGLYSVSMGRHVVLKGQRALAMKRVAALVPQYLKTSLRNADVAEAFSRDIDRDARVFFLPEKWVGLWRAVARERAEAFLEGVDNWLEDHTRSDESGPVREVAIHCYAYTGEPRSPKPGGTNIGRLEGGGSGRSRLCGASLNGR